MQYRVYILQSESTRRFYIGQTGDLEKRIERHNHNRVSATRNRGPWQLVHEEKYNTRGEAMQRERYIKKLKDRRYIEKLIAG